MIVPIRYRVESDDLEREMPSSPDMSARHEEAVRLIALAQGLLSDKKGLAATYLDLALGVLSEELYGKDSTGPVMMAPARDRG